MKTKVLFILLSVLFIMPINAIPHKKHRHKVNAKIISSNYKTTTRSPLFFSLTADETDNNLAITFQFPLEEADITATNKDGNIVVSELNSSIYEGKTVYVPNSDSYPYLVEITSPCLDIEVEITSEDY
ncbi:hypothetical protein [Bacteroides intestinalis]|jgi:hypothetical protein|uniref:hypothetical protein n=1 Tax=Bacteroides intestinalis TaxID=329854 RepID=UPI000E4F3D99|nr:hypothetical protein [Bacteroides intestinalis]RGX86312.1 hypothetical protein DXA61_06730 [Bacteroides intestinalis]